MMYEEIKELYDYCQEIGIHAEMEEFLGGYAIRFPNGDDIVQHTYSYGSSYGYVEPAIGCEEDYSAVSLERAKELVLANKERLNG